MKKVDAHTAASVLEDELFALLQDIRKARFAMDILLGNMIPEEDITNVSHEWLWPPKQQDIKAVKSYKKAIKMALLTPKP